MAAMMIHGINPGPMLAITAPELIYNIVAMLIVADMVKLLYGLVLVRPLLYVLLIPRERLMPIVLVLCTVGAFAITQRLFDVWVMLGAGLVGFVLRELRFPMAPLVLGVVLGELLDKNLLRGLVLSGGDVSPFFTRPISAGLCALTVIAALWSIPAVTERLRGLIGRTRTHAQPG
jgi:putative tricarboxylic transport membrane protein